MHGDDALTIVCLKDLANFLVRKQGNEQVMFKFFVMKHICNLLFDDHFFILVLGFQQSITH